MSTQLSEQDKDFVWQVVLREAERCGGHDKLFLTPLEFDDEGGRVRFHWPEWMQEIRAFITAKYGERDVQYRLLEVVSEVMSRERYDARRYAARRSGNDLAIANSLWR